MLNDPVSTMPLQCIRRWVVRVMYNDSLRPQSNTLDTHIDFRLEYGFIASYKSFSLCLTLWLNHGSEYCLNNAVHAELTLLASNKMAVISQTISYMHFRECKVGILNKISLKLFLRVQLTITQHWVRYWLGDEQASPYFNQCWPIHWRIYATLGADELRLPLLWFP